MRGRVELALASGIEGVQELAGDVGFAALGPAWNQSEAHGLRNQIACLIGPNHLGIVGWTDVVENPHGAAPVFARFRGACLHPQRLTRDRESWQFGELIEAATHAESYLEQPRRHPQNGDQNGATHEVTVTRQEACPSIADAVRPTLRRLTSNSCSHGLQWRD